MNDLPFNAMVIHSDAIDLTDGGGLDNIASLAWCAFPWNVGVCEHWAASSCIRPFFASLLGDEQLRCEDRITREKERRFVSCWRPSHHRNQQHHPTNEKKQFQKISFCVVRWHGGASVQVKWRVPIVVKLVQKVRRQPGPQFWIGFAFMY